MVEIKTAHGFEIVKDFEGNIIDIGDEVITMDNSGLIRGHIVDISTKSFTPGLITIHGNRSVRVYSSKVYKITK